MSWKDSLFEEKSLWEIFKKSPGVSARKFNRWIVGLVTVLALLSAIATVWAIGQSLVTQLELISTARSWANFGSTLSSTVLGFLIAGFTVFAATMPVKLFVRLAQVSAPPPNQSLSRLKYIFFNFINAFVHYVAYLSASVFVVFASSPGGIVSIFFRYLDQYYAHGRIGVILIFFIAYSVWTSMILLKLKSFVWNVYGGVMLSIAAAEESPPNNSQPR